MNEYITNWMNVIDNVKDDHTHEIAWGKAIIDCISLKQYELKENIVYVTQYDIAKNIIRYYWNQTYFFELNQGNYKGSNMKKKLIFLIPLAILLSCTNIINKERTIIFFCINYLKF